MFMSIVFDNPSKTYYAGQNVTGQVIIRVQKPKKFRDISIACKGKAHVQWTESRSNTNSDSSSSSTTDTFTGNEKYFEHNARLAGGSSDGTVLQPGEYLYPFSFQLSHNIPSSFEYKLGTLVAYVRYTVTVVMDRPWRFNHDCKTAFTVISPLDLNYVNPVIKMPVTEQQSKTFTSLLRKSGPLKLRVELPCSGYVSGQTIPVKVVVQNSSNVSVQHVICVLKKVVTFHSTSGNSSCRKKREEKIVIARFAFNQKVQPHNSKLFTQAFNIPPLPPSNLEHCRIVDIEYFLKVEAVTGAFHKNLKAVIPITLGTVPLLTGPTMLVTTPIPASVPSAPKKDLVPPFASSQFQPTGTGIVPSAADSSSASAPSAPPAYADLPPPSYEESILGGMNIKEDDDTAHTMGLSDFTPLYPVWKFAC